MGSVIRYLTPLLAPVFLPGNYSALPASDAAGFATTSPQKPHRHDANALHVQAARVAWSVTGSTSGLEKAHAGSAARLIVPDLVSGRGHVEAADVEFEETDSPGNSPGCISIGGNATFGAGDLVNNGTIGLNGLVSTLGWNTVTNNSLLTGNGHVTATLDNSANGEIRATLGNTLTFMGGGNSKSRRINLLGGTAEVTQGLTNTSGGVIAGRGTLITGGLTNQGYMGLSSGNTDVLGNVNNDAGGSIIVSGNGTVTFSDDVVHNGAEIRVSNGSSAVFFGSVAGSGPCTGTGSLFFEGDLNPGISPGMVSIGGDMSLGMSARTIMEVAGLVRASEYDVFGIGGNLTLGGALEVKLYTLGGGLFDPQMGNSFDMFAAPVMSGDFDTLCMAAPGHDWAGRLTCWSMPWA